MSEKKSQHHVPPGFRFHPTDEELINYYLKKKMALDKFDLDHVIQEVDLNKLEPWDLREKCKVDASHQTEWYFFSHKDKKYPTGTRTNRATKAGFWKATGRDKAVLSSVSRHHHAGQCIGMRKTLVFYKGRAPHGLKTNWIMHEYRLQDANLNHQHTTNAEDGWVVCRVFKKRNYEEKSSTSASSSYDHQQSNSNLSDEVQPAILRGVGSKPAEKSPKKQGETINNIINAAAAPTTTTNIAFPCKQEMVEDQGPHQPTFWQLPQLQSPTLAPNPIIIRSPSQDTLHASANQFKRVNLADPGGQRTQQMLQYPHNHSSSIEMQEVLFNGKAFFMTEEDLAHYIDSSNGQIADNYHWSLHDNLARHHGIDSIFNFAGDQLFLQFNAHLSRIQQPVDNHPSTCEIELWNFPR